MTNKHEKLLKISPQLNFNSSTVKGKMLNSVFGKLFRNFPLQVDRSTYWKKT